jgi:transcription elongation factor GreA-like protein
VAVYIINDVLWELNETREKFVVEKIPSLTESISREILDEIKRVQFQKDMLKLIKNYEIS